MPKPDWTRPGAHPVADGVHRVVLPMPQDGLKAVNVYVLEGAGGLALIDAGWRVPGNVELLGDGLRNNVPASSLRELSRAGGAGLAAWIDEMTRDSPWSEKDWEDPDGWLEPGPVTVAGRAMEAVLVPGHTNGHLVFHDELDVLVARGALEVSTCDRVGLFPVA